MEQRDYILRMIEQFGRFALALRRLITGGGAGSQRARDQLTSVAQNAGLDLDLARVATAETLLMLAAPTGELDPARCWMYAETLYLDGLDAELSGDVERAWSAYGRARALFAAVAPMGAFLVGFPEARERIEEIDDRMAALESGDDGGAGSQRRRGRRGRQRAPAGS
jgi:hypothetical protein